MALKAVCISNFHYYDNRLEYVDEYLTSKGYDVTYITTDYDTVVKSPITVDIPNAIQIPVIHYKKNLSFERIYSHYRFGKDLYRMLEEIQPQIVFAMAPPNFVGYFCAKYKKKYPHTKFILDIYDLWPETFPSNKAKQLLKLPFYYWSYLRDSSIRIADAVTTECFYYQERLQHVFNSKVNKFVLYLSKKEQSGERYPKQPANGLHIAYLGSINNVTDIEMIIRLMAELQKHQKTTLHLIGTGENRKRLIEGLKMVGVTIQDYGKVFDEQEKLAILSQCHFGLNMMKPTVAIGLTMKSVDYFHAALPILNTVEGDTKTFILQNDVGIHVDRHRLDETVLTITQRANDAVAMQTLKKNAYELYQEHFTPKAIRWVIKELFQQINV